jgi:hypothetical protein
MYKLGLKSQVMYLLPLHGIYHISLMWYITNACQLIIDDISQILGGCKKHQMPFGVVEETQVYVPNCWFFG